MRPLVLTRHDSLPAALRGGAVTVGNFDGVHRGHQALVAAAGQLAWPCVAVTFDPPPVALLNPAALRLPLSTLDERAAALHAAGADAVVALATDAELLALSAEAFVADVLARRLGATAVAEGANFRFGRDRQGDTAALRRLCRERGLRFEEVPAVLEGGSPVSSSRVRAAVETGDVATAADLLGRPYRIAGTVVEGAKRGRTIGVPTANLADVPTLVPGVGVYAVRAEAGGRWWPAAANVGPNPTFGDDARKIEVHLIGFAGDLYGRRLAVEFGRKLRDTRPFASAAELVEQVRRDIHEAARGFAEDHP